MEWQKLEVLVACLAYFVLVAGYFGASVAEPVLRFKADWRALKKFRRILNR